MSNPLSFELSSFELSINTFIYTNVSISVDINNLSQDFIADNIYILGIIGSWLKSVGEPISMNECII